MVSNFAPISGERTTEGKLYFQPTFFQHQKTYSFCTKYTRSKRVLDAGCGTGAGAFLLSKIAKEMVAVDTDRDAIKYSRKMYKRRNLTYKRIGVLDIRDKKKFNTVVSLQVIEHIEEVDTYIAKIKGLLKPKGIVIFSTPNSLTQSYNENPYHVHEYLAEELLILLKEYFQTVLIYGLHGDKQVERYERARKKFIIPSLQLDIFRLRYFLPKTILQRMFDFATIFCRLFFATEKNSKKRISMKNYKINKQTKNAIDLIAVCRNPK